MRNYYKSALIIRIIYMQDNEKRNITTKGREEGKKKERNIYMQDLSRQSVVPTYSTVRIKVHIVRLENNDFLLDFN